MQHKNILTPIKVGILWSILTFLLFLFGCWTYPACHKIALIVLIVFYNFSMYFGFKLGTRALTRHYIPRWSSAFFLRRLYNICLIGSLILFIPRFILYTGIFNGLNISSIISTIQYSLGNINEVHVAARTNASGIWVYINYLVVFFSPLLWCFTPLSIYLWKENSKFDHCFAIIFWVTYIAQYLISATNSGVIGMLFYIVMSYLFTKMARGDGITKQQKRRLIFILSGTIIVFFAIFAFAMSQRVGVNYRTKVLGMSTIYYNKDSLFNKIIVEPLRPTFAIITWYLGQGYYALGSALDLDWVPTFLTGGSRFLMQNVSGIIGIDIFKYTYQMRLYNAIGWHYDVYWHTAYLWLANDFSIIGVGPFLFVLFTLVGKSWKDFLNNGNIMGLFIILLFSQFMFYISANNTVFSYYDTFMTILFLIGLSHFAKQVDWEGDMYE